MPFPLALALLLASTGAQVATSAIGARSANKSNKRAMDYQAEADREAMDFERMRFEDERRFRDAQAALDNDRWTKTFGAVEDERLFRRNQLAPYREAGAQALRRLPDLMGPRGQFGWRSPSQVGRVPMSLSDLVRG